MIKHIKNPKFLKLFQKNGFSYISSLPEKKNQKSFEEFIKNEMISAFDIDQRLKEILENEDTQDETIKSYFK